MERSITADILHEAECLMIDGDFATARDKLARLAEDIEEYVDKNCPTTSELQWFSFPTIFERLAYRRVEDDPRELRDVGEPFDRVYYDLALCETSLSDMDAAIEALKLAARWNPMECSYRLNLADLFRLAGNQQEYLALTFSVFERASDPSHLVQAYANFAGWFLETGRADAAAAAVACAKTFGVPSGAIDFAADRAASMGADPADMTPDRAEEILAGEGLPFGANAEMAVCLLMCATDAASAGERNLATKLTLRARDLVGEPAAMALLKLIREGDETTGEEVEDAG